VRRYLVLAGKAAQASAAAEEAEGWFDRALETLEFEEEPDAMERADNLFLRGLARRTLGRWEEAASDWDEALPILEARGHSELVARICRDLAYKNVWENRSAEAHALIDRGLRAVGEASSGARCRLLAIRSYAFSVAGEIVEAETVIEAALAMAEALGDEALLAGEVLLARMYLQQHSFRFAKMATNGERAVEILRRVDRPWDLSNALGGTLLAWAMQGRFDVVAQHVGEAEALALREGDLGNRFHIHCVRSFLEMSRGRPPAARDNLQASVEVAREAGFPWDSIVQALQGVAELKSGDWKAARATLDDAQAHAVEGTWRGIEASARLLGLVYTGDPEAPALLERLLPDLPSASAVGRSGAWSMVAPVVEAALLLGKPEVAAGLHSVLLRAIDEGCVVFWGFGLTERLAGMASAAAGRRETAQRHFATALEQAESLPYAVDRPEILLWRARLCVDRDASARARDLAAARVDYERFGMARHVVWIDETLTDLEY
jgi:tetratricopeptide (TPR) repeat protein